VGFALVEVLAGPASQLGILDPVESEERAFQAFRRPSSRSAAATPFCLGWEASWRMISEAVTVPPRMDARILRISAQCARSDYGDTTSNNRDPKSAKTMYWSTQKVKSKIPISLD
jgi:hypothetical protein